MGEIHDLPTNGPGGNSLTQVLDQKARKKPGKSTGLRAIVFGADSQARKRLHERLRESGHDVVSTDDVKTARDVFGRHRSDMVFLCGLDGDAFEFSKYARRLEGDRVVVVAYVDGADAPAARSALRAGLDDIVTDRHDQYELDATVTLTARRAERRKRWVTLERELRESEGRFRALAEHSTDMISRHAPDGTYTYASPACRRLLGYEPEDLVGRSAYEFFHPDDVSTVRQSHDSVLENPDVRTVVFRLRRKDGHYAWFESTSQMVRDEAGVVSSIIAVTRSRDDDSQITSFAARCRRELMNTQRLANIGTWYWDVGSSRVTVSDEVYRVLGLDRDSVDLTPERFLQVVHPQDRHLLEDRLGAARHGAPSLQVYFRVIRPDGEIRTLCGRGEREEADGVQKFVGTVQDFTELAAAEEALLDREAQYRAILETTVDGIMTIDERGIVESFNKAAEKIFGYRSSEVISKNVSMLMPHHYAEEHDNYIRTYLETGRKKIIGIGREVIGRRKNGTTFPLELAVSEVDLQDRRIFCGIIRDVSERRQLEQQILNISEQERQRIGQDLHDGLGQMLTGIGLIMKSVSKRLNDRGLEEADDVEEVTELIREADEFARSLARGLVPVELDSGGLASAFMRLMVNAEKLFGLECHFEQAGGELEIDNTIATHLYRIAQEALSNAVRHGQASQVRVVLATGEGHVRLRVLDNGRGFPEKLDKNHPGMGIRIMRHRARIIGATLEIRSRAEGGTVVACTLPQAAALQANV